MNDFDEQIDSRLAALVARAPGRDDPPALAPRMAASRATSLAGPARRRSGRFALSLTMAPVGVPVGTVASWLSRGRTALRRRLDPDAGRSESTETAERPGPPLEGAIARPTVR